MPYVVCSIHEFEGQGCGLLRDVRILHILFIYFEENDRNGREARSACIDSRATFVAYEHI